MPFDEGLAALLHRRRLAQRARQPCEHLARRSDRVGLGCRGPSGCRSTTCAPIRRRRRGGRPPGAARWRTARWRPSTALYGAMPGRRGVGRQRRHDQHVAAPVEHRRQRRPHRVEHPDDVDVDEASGTPPDRPASTEPYVAIPALATTTSMPPNRATACSAAVCMARRSRTSATAVSTRSVTEPRCDLVEPRPRRGRSAPVSRPWRAVGAATSAPTPCAPPVMNTTFPLTEPMAGNVLHRDGGSSSALLDAEQCVDRRWPPGAGASTSWPPYSSASVLQPSRAASAFGVSRSSAR